MGGGSMRETGKDVHLKYEDKKPTVDEYFKSRPNAHSPSTGDRVTFADQHITDLKFLAEMIDQATSELYNFYEFLFGTEPAEVQQAMGDERSTWTNDVRNGIDNLKQSIQGLHTVKDKLNKFYL